MHSNLHMRGSRFPLRAVVAGVSLALALACATVRAADLTATNGSACPFQHLDEGGGAVSAAGGHSVPYSALGGSVYHSGDERKSTSAGHHLYAGWVNSDPKPAVRAISGWTSAAKTTVVVSGVWQNTSASVYLEWTDPNSIADDTFFYTTDGTEPTISSTSTAGTSLTLGPFNPGTTTIRIRPRSNLGLPTETSYVWGASTAFSFRYNTTVPNPPATPTIAEGAWAGTPSITVVWTAPTPPPNATITDYRIVAGTSPGAADVFDSWIGSNATTYTLDTSNSNIAPGDTIYVIVYAKSSTGYVSATSSPTSAPVVIADVPGTGRMSAEGGSVVPFHAVDEGGTSTEAAGGHKTPYSEVGGGVFLTGDGRAIASAGSQMYTGFVYTDPPPDLHALRGWTDSSKTTEIVAGEWQSGSSQVYLEWTDPNSIADDTFYYTTDGTVPTQTSPTSASSGKATNVTITSLPAGDTTIRVRARSDINGQGAQTVIWGPTHSFLFRYNPAIPPAPTGVTVTEGPFGPNPYITVAWNAVVDSSGTPVSDYYVEVNLSSDFSGTVIFAGWVGSTTTSFRVDSATNAPALANDQTVYVRVKAKNVLGNVGSTSTPTAGTRIGSTAPDGLIVNSVVDGAQGSLPAGSPPTITGVWLTRDHAAIAFSAVYRDDAGAAVTKFQIQLSTNSDFSVTGDIVWDSSPGGVHRTLPKTVQKDTRCHDLPYSGSAVLSYETTYYWRMRFVAADATVSAWSAGQSFRVTAGVAQDATVGHTGSGGSGAPSFVMRGAVTHRFAAIVEAGAVAVKLYMVKDAGYSGADPTITVSGPGITTNASCTAALGTWQEITLSGTASARGAITITVTTFGAATSETCHVDDFTVN
ncbi:MAG: hypothetical protein HY719_00245 [Planctomycetes bacterium]|nr:hypothetical protein [Planctomycetota bacterium]